MIEISGLTVCYGEKIALSDISLNVPDGSFTCFIGPNGSGKTTLLKAIGGHIPVLKGDIAIGGRLVMSMKDTERAKRIAYLPQSRPIPDMTALTMIRHGRFPHQGFARKLSSEDHKAVEDAINLTGTEQLLDKPIVALSGGERQRVYIAMALAQGSDIMLLDEPSSGLDLRYQVELIKIVEALHRQGKTIIMVSHDLPLAFSSAQNVCLMNCGQLLRNAPPDDRELMALIPEVFGYSLRKSVTVGDELFQYQIIK